MRKFLLSVAVLAVALSPSVAHAAVSHCPDKDHPGKVQTPPRDHVPTAGSEICVKAGQNNTGKLIADGATTLADYLKAAGIVGGDGEGRDPSYVIIYQYVPPTTPTTTTTTEPETEEPSTTTTTTTEPTSPPSTTPTTVPSENTSPTSTPTTVTPSTSPKFEDPATMDKPKVSVPTLNCMTPDGHPFRMDPTAGACPTSKTGQPGGTTTPTPTTAPTPRTELPATGGSNVLTAVGFGLLGVGIAFLLVRAFIR